MSKYANTLYYGPKSWTFNHLRLLSYVNGQHQSIIQKYADGRRIGIINYWLLQGEQLDMHNISAFCEQCDVIFFVSEEVLNRLDTPLFPEPYPIEQLFDMLDQYNVWYIGFSGSELFKNKSNAYSTPWFRKSPLYMEQHIEHRYHKKSYIWNCLLGKNKAHRTKIWHHIVDNSHIYKTYFGHDSLRSYSNTEFESAEHLNVLLRQDVRNNLLDTFGCDGTVDTDIGPIPFSHIIPTELYDATHFDLVSETVHNKFDIQEPFITEKTAKPLATGRYFAWFGAENTVEYLQQYGFDFTDYYTDYDKYSEEHVRLGMLTEHVNSITTESQVEHIYNVTHKNRMHNKDVYWKLRHTFNEDINAFVLRALGVE